MGDFDRLARSKRRSVRVVGGGANSALWCQMMADVLERPLLRVEKPELAGARGAAMAAAVAAGWHTDLAAASAMVRTDRTFEPYPELRGLYAERFERFAAAYKRLRPWYDRYGLADSR
jgi:xylulokinase